MSDRRRKTVERFRSLSLFLVLSFLICFGTGCVSSIHIVEGTTILENDVAGEWPDFSQGLADRLKKEGPTFYSRQDSSSAKKRALNNVNGELVVNDEK